MYFQKIVGIFYKFEKNTLSQQINDCSTYIFNVCWNRIDMDVFILLILAENKISDNFSVSKKNHHFSKFGETEAVETNKGFIELGS